MTNTYNSAEAKQARVEAALNRYYIDPSDIVAGCDIVRFSNQGMLKTDNGECIDLEEKNVLFKVLRLAKEFKLRYNSVDS
jgi:hypothetical protein